MNSFYKKLPRFIDCYLGCAIVSNIYITKSIADHFTKWKMMRFNNKYEKSTYNTYWWCLLPSSFVLSTGLSIAWPIILPIFVIDNKMIPIENTK